MKFDITENSQSFFHGSKIFWATGSRVMVTRAMQRVYPRSEQQKASPWRLTMPLVRGWDPAIERYQRATSSPSALEGRHCVKRYNSEGNSCVSMSHIAAKHNIVCVIYYIAQKKPCAHSKCVIIQQITLCVQSIKVMPVDDLFIKELFVRNDTLATRCCHTAVSFLLLQSRYNILAAFVLNMHRFVWAVNLIADCLFPVSGFEWHMGVVSLVVWRFYICELKEDSVWGAYLQMWGWAIWGEAYCWGHGYA